MLLITRRDAALNNLGWLCYAALMGFSFSKMGSLSAYAQSIRADSSALTTVSTSDNQNFTITDGQTADDNLFHSFADFSIPNGGSATFDNATSIANIISRVTGDRISDIQGRLSTQGSANLFLINPNGIVFGKNAELNIGGSFIGSTASSILFPNQGQFSTIDTQPNPLLSISAPIGLYMEQAAGEIRVEDNGYQTLAKTPLTIDSSSGLQVRGGSSLVLIGNGVSFTGGRAIAPGGLLAIGSVESGQIDLAENSWTPSYEDVTAFNDVELSERSLLNASNGIHNASGQLTVLAASGGDIQVQGRRISAVDSSLALIQNFSNQPFGDLNIRASERVALSAADSAAQVAAGFVTANFAPINPTQLISGQIDPTQLTGGNINIATSHLELIDDGIFSAETFSAAPGGQINIQAETVRLLEINQSNPQIDGGIQTVSFSPIISGTAGNINLSANNLLVSAHGISSQALNVADSGVVHINSNAIELRNGSTIASSTLGSGNSGVTVVTADRILVSGIDPVTFLPSAILVSTVASGNAGNLIINTRELTVTEGGLVGASTISTGDAGQVTINASESVNISGTVPGSINPSLIISGANVVDPQLRFFLESRGVLGIPPVPTGNAGDVTINTPELFVSDGAQITVRNDGPGNAGDLAVNAQSIYLRDRAGITASTEQGGGGNLLLNAEDILLLRQAAGLSAEAKGDGDGGNITLNTANLVAVENSDIIANAEAGQGGNIQINARNIVGTQFREFLTEQSDITASSQFGSSGVVEINNLTVSADSGLVKLPDTVDDSSRHIIAGCSESQSSEFIATGRGGLALDPAQVISNNHIWTDIRPFVHEQQISQQMAERTSGASANSARANEATASTASIIAASVTESHVAEASGWQHSAGGEVVLYANERTRHAQLATNCLAAS